MQIAGIFFALAAASTQAASSALLSHFSVNALPFSYFIFFKKL